MMSKRAKFKVVEYGLGGMPDLVRATGLSRDTLFRLKKAGYFREHLRINERRVYYDLAEVTQAIRRIGREKAKGPDL